jgi:hypothetical protein
MRKILASLAMFLVLLAGSLAGATPARADFNQCRYDGWCMWLYPNWTGPGEYGWQWNGSGIVNNLPGSKLSFAGQQWNNYTAGWYNNSGYAFRLYLDENCTSTRYLYFAPGDLKFASPSSGGLNNEFYRKGSCVKWVGA